MFEIEFFEKAYQLFTSNFNLFWYGIKITLLLAFLGTLFGLIIGLMLGSLYAIVQGPTTLDEPLPAMTFWGSFSLPTLSTGTFSVLFFLLGGAIIIGLQVLKAVIEKSNSKAKEKSE